MNITLSFSLIVTINLQLQAFLVSSFVFHIHVFIIFWVQSCQKYQNSPKRAQTRIDLPLVLEYHSLQVVKSDS